MCRTARVRWLRCAALRLASRTFCLTRVRRWWCWPATRRRRRRCTPCGEAFPNTPFVGMEPAVKPAAEQSHTGVVAVLATPATFQGALFASVVERFAHGVEVIAQVCPGLVEQIEAGELDTATTEAMLRGWVEPLLARNIDALVLGCTHYPFVRPLLERICGPSVPRDRSRRRRGARQVGRVLPATGEATSQGLANTSVHGQRKRSQKSLERPRLETGGVGGGCAEPRCGTGSSTYYTSGPVARLQVALARLGFGHGTVLGATWHGNQLVAEDPTARFPTQTAG